jgi:aromatic ring-opening dioxygenase catalytic subunit (LigB family)
VATVMTSAQPPLLYDYHGFPDAAYKLAWPAPGAPQLARRVRALLSAAGIASREECARGFDHGAFVPLMVAFPDAGVPATQLSLLSSLDPGQHLALGAALAPLRAEGVLIVASGMSYHNMRGLMARGSDRDAARVLTAGVLTGRPCAARAGVADGRRRGRGRQRARRQRGL